MATAVSPSVGPQPKVPMSGTDLASSAERTPELPKPFQFSVASLTKNQAEHNGQDPAKFVASAPVCTSGGPSSWVLRRTVTVSANTSNEIESNSASSISLSNKFVADPHAKKKRRDVVFCWQMQHQDDVNQSLLATGPTNPIVSLWLSSAVRAPD